MARKILLADDSVTAQNMGRKILTDAGYEVVTVNNGSAALKKILEAKPDLVVLDVYMPGYSGLEVCQRIKENKDSARIPILLTVGKLEPFKPEEARRVRADAFVVKPFEASELLAALARMEDKIVPQPEPYKQGRFARAVAAVDELSDTEKDESWKARLRIPVQGEKEPETRPEPEPAPKGFRDFKSDDSGRKPKAPHREGVFEPPLPSGLPGDITPEEIAALTAAAAQLRGSSSHPSIPDLHRLTPAVPTAGDLTTTVTERDASSPVTFASAPELPVPSDGVSLAQANSESRDETVEGVASEEDSVDDITVSLAHPPIEVAESHVEAQEVAAKPSVAASDLPKIDVQVENPAQPEIARPESPVSETKTATPAGLDASRNVAPPAVPEPTAPVADDEVMAALQSLMPVEGNSPQGTKTPAILDTNSGLASLVAQVDSTMVKAHAAGPRWIAEEIALSEDEASLSLEREMEQAYAAAASADVRVTSAVAVIEATAPASTEASTPEPRTAPASELQPAETAVAYAMAASASEAGAMHAASAVALPHPEPQSIHESEAGVAGTSVPVSPALQSAHTEPNFTTSVGSQAAPNIEISGGVEDMAASWKNIRDSIATGGSAKAALAKEKEEKHSAAEAQEAPPQAPEPATHPSASDPKAIASIVDSVLAELRPKIVEEIAKKLADSKKE